MIGSKRSTVSGGEVGDRFEAIIASSGLGVSRKPNPKVMLGGVGIVVAGALLGGLAFGSGRDSHKILVAAHPIEAGVVLEAADVRAVEVSGVPAVKSTSPVAIASVLGRVSLSPIAEGAVLTSEQFRLHQSAPDGTGLVGVVLDPGALPTPDLRYGDQVDVMVSASPNAVIDEPARVVTRASVWRVWGGTQAVGRRTVTLAIPQDLVPAVGDAAARNLIRLVVVPTENSAWPVIGKGVVAAPLAGVSDPVVADVTVAP